MQVNDAPLRLDELFRDDLVAHAPPVEYVDSLYEDECVDDELLLLDKQFENEFTKFGEKISVDEHKISSNHVVEKMSTLITIVRCIYG